VHNADDGDSARASVSGVRGDAGVSLVGGEARCNVDAMIIDGGARRRRSGGGSGGVHGVARKSVGTQPTSSWWALASL
jgi:hypothetical protein